MATPLNRRRDLPGILSLALLYGAIAKITLSYFSTSGNVTLVWFSGGLGLAVLLLKGLRFWPGIFLGALAAGLMVNDSLWLSGLIAAGNTLETLTAARLLGNNRNFSVTLSEPKHFLTLVLVGVVCSAISAAIGPAALLASGYVPARELGESMLHWWMADVFGIVFATPATLIWRRWPSNWFHGKRWPETVIFVGLSFLVGQILFFDWFTDHLKFAPHTYWPFFCVLWGALRFGRHGVVLVMVLTAAQALLGAAQHVGKFAHDFEQSDLFNFWLFMAALSTCGMALALTLHSSRRIAEELLDSELRLRHIVDASPVPHILYDRHDNVVFFNSAFSATFGYTQDDIRCRDDWWRLAYPDPAYRDSIMAVSRRHLSASLNRQDIAPEKVDIRCRDGATLTALANTTALSDSLQGGYLVTYFDITERMRYEKALTESNLLLQTILETLPVRVFWKDLNSRYLGCNTLFANDAGRRRASEMLGKDDTQMTWRDQADLYRSDDVAVMSSGTPKLNFEEPQTTPSGDTIWLRTSKMPLINGDGVTIGILGLYEDITQNKQSQQQLAESLSMLQATLEATTAGILVVSLDGYIRGFNQRFQALWQIPRDMLREGDHCHALLEFILKQMKDPELTRAQVNELREHPEREIKNLLELIDGRLLERYSRPQRIGDRIIGRVWSYTDVTELRGLEKQLQWRTAFLEAVLESTPDGIVAVDAEGRKVQQNLRIGELWRMPPDLANQDCIAAQLEMARQQMKHPEQMTRSIALVQAQPDAIARDEVELLDDTILEFHTAPICSKTGAYLGRIWQFRDVTATRHAERTLRQKEYYQRALLDNIPHAIWLKDRDSRFLAVNQEFSAIFDAGTPDELVGKSDLDIAPPELAERYRADDRTVMATRANLVVEEEIIDRGLRKWYETYKAPVIDQSGELLGSVGFARDVSERRKAEENLRLAALVYQNSSEAMVVTDADNNILSVNPAFTLMTGYAADEVVGRNPRVLKSDQHDAGFYRELWRALEETGTWHGEIKNRRKDGRIYVEELTINTIYDASGHPQRRVALFSDITQRKQSEEQIWRQANFDPLTGLPNRRMFRDRLEQEIKKAHRMGQMFALMFIDLDRFKEVNDTLGHDIGDQLLKETAQRLQLCVRESDTVARLGGDEFTIILGELDEPRSAEPIARHLLEQLSAPFQLAEDTTYVSASIGITFYPTDSTDLSELLKNADQAMYAAKNRGRNAYSFFTKALQDALQARAALLADLRNALSERQLSLHYQPIVDLVSGEVHKSEALLRWRHPTRGVVSPTEFIPLAEETGLINKIGDWVFETAAQQVLEWQSRLHREFQISINKSPVQFQSAGQAPRHWFDYLHSLGLSGQSIVVEITEGLLLDANTNVQDHLMAFRDAGMQVAIDDFGTGYSSLSYLKKFDIDYLKIDQSFVRNLTEDSSDFALCEAIIVMAHKLGLKVIAEGVETERQRDLLKSIGCDYGQGYWFSPPVPAELFTQRFSLGRDREN
ncbi:EAL domain-containing protein [Methylomonas sp. MED-D]|uniref:EAL domain-containing protein n=1 Tax=unclassified Methylomonas TaxID=2608980 RepID=UPI0028A4AFEA|nr:EAL domain-containing protein [Methylomonas sp. MV1]MDT4330938.1 EAL domain-containing protein [Methylomonas sp. MV1]